MSASPQILFVDLSESGDPLNDINALAEVCEPGTVVIAAGEVNDVRLYRDLVSTTEAGGSAYDLEVQCRPLWHGDPYAETMRIRIEGTRALVSAARQAGVRRMITQSISFMCSPTGTGFTDEDTPLYVDGPAGAGALAKAVASLEQQTLDAYPEAAIVLRYGWFFGPGTSYDPNDAIPNGLRAGTLPIAGSGAGNYSFIDLRDAARATVKAVKHEASGIFNIVDDTAVCLREFLPAMATLLGAPQPQTMSEAVALEKFGDLRVYYWNEQRPASNAKAKSEFGWEPRFPVWPKGFEELYSASDAR